MPTSNKTIASMQSKGFYLATGVARIGDVVCVELKHPFKQIKAITLNTLKSVETYNNEINLEGWAIYRKQ